MTRKDKDVLAAFVKRYTLGGVLHQLGELCREKDSEECEKPEGNHRDWASIGEDLEELAEKCWNSRVD